MSVEPTPERNPLRPFFGIALVLLFLALLAVGLKSYRDLGEARLQVTELEREVFVAKERIRALELRIVRLKDDPHTLERLAREELGLVEPGDVVIVLPEPEAPEEAPSPFPVP